VGGVGVPVAESIGPHEIIAPLGEGGMGAVYKARDSRLGRIVALKVVRPEWTGDAERTRRFIQEARTASALNHPNIVTIYEIGVDHEVDYIAMEFVDGETLAEIVARGPLPEERALRLVGQVADALSAAHAAGIVHRDLKPSNIMVATGDRVKVVDFGLAKLVESASAPDETADVMTVAGAVVGTAPYMSPEQAEGRPLDARSDLFSVGTILYEILSGARPFGGASAAGTLAAILRDPAPPLVGVRPEIVRLVERCLCKQASERFQSAIELKAAIDSCLAPQAGIESAGVAVLPFANMSGASDDDVLCEGLAEEVINALTRIPGLRVIARTSAFAVGRMGLDIREAGARLGVDSILEGSVRRAGARVRVAAQLVKASDASHLWSERYDRELTDVLALEDEIAEAIAGRLRGSLGRVEPRLQSQRSAVDAEAHAAYLEGRHYFARGTPAALAQAEACYQRAIGRDAGFALAYDSLAELYWFLGFFGGAPPREAFAQSTWYALRALELDDTLAEAHALLGMLRKELDYNWLEVDRELRRARDLNGRSQLVRLRYAISGLLPHGRVGEALAELDVALRDDPLSLFLRWWVAVMAVLDRRFERAIEEGRHMIALEPAHFLGHWALGLGLDATGAGDEALAALRRAHELSGGSPFTLGFLACACGRAGRREEAQALLSGAARAAGERYVPPSTFAFGCVGVGDRDAAFEWLERTIEGRDPLIMPIKTYYFLDPLRDDPRFAALLRKMNLGP
jgi:eukaryotic-like serine/threonine-protein kinase